VRRVSEGRRFVRFLFVGLLNTAFGFAAYAALIYAGAPVWLALIGGNVAGICFNFLTTGHFVFLDASLERLPRFAGVYLLCYAVNYAAVRMFIHMGLGSIVAQALISPCIAGISFLLMSRYVFKTSRLSEVNMGRSEKP
jgi:putative flippase GtrA